jgi:hypothetical protein
MPEFFIPGRTYRHHREDGSPSPEGLFLVAFVGRAPEPFEHHSETLGVAFGWRQGIDANGTWEALGSYETPDFAGWVEVLPVDSTDAEPDGCRWCGDAPGHHGSQFMPGIGLHRWVQPSDRQRLERMRNRRAARTTAAQEA